uniref:Uncharacterized protein n=1 Tax=Arundo donax TaxID=35708 RepID=A0A0A8YHV2_ARUDO
MRLHPVPLVFLILYIVICGLPPLSVYPDLNTTWSFLMIIRITYGLFPCDSSLTPFPPSLTFFPM